MCRAKIRRLKILALDTSTEHCSVALWRDGEVDAREAVAGQRHSQMLLPMVDELLERHELTVTGLDGIAFGQGPGSFTGLRIAMATAKGLCFAAGLPLWPVSSLAALALDAVDTLAAADPPEETAGALFVPLLDARRDEVFAGLYRAERGGVTAIAPDAVIPVADLAAVVAAAVTRTGSRRAILLGDALDGHGDALASAGELVAGSRSTPSARSVGRLAALGDRADALKSGTPVYIRPSEAEVKFPNGNPGGHRSDKS